MKLPRFTLRDLFWLVLVCAMTTGWWADRSRLSDKIERLIRPRTDLKAAIEEAQKMRTVTEVLILDD